LLRNHFHFSIRIKTEEEYLASAPQDPKTGRVKKFDPSQF
jgi:hypothetical protein